MLPSMIPEGIFTLETLITSWICAFLGLVITMTFIVILQVVADHKCFTAATLLALIRPLIGMSSHMLPQVTLSGELLAALNPVTVECVARVKPCVGIEPVQGCEGVGAAIHLAHKRLLTSMYTDVDL